jgi:SAM-dependent methyltransferase
VKTEKIKKVVRSRYGKAAQAADARGSCCCPSAATSDSSFATEHGLYCQDEFCLVPEIARNLSRGCGNPTGFANLQSDEVVVDLGCGAGIDAILAARSVGPGGKVVGVDFAPEMIERAEQAVAEAGLTDSVELVVGDMEQLNLPDSFADVVISNCVINLSPEKSAVYREAFRILKPGGRLAISDIVLTEKIEPHLQARLHSTWSGCLGGAIDEDSYFDIIRKAGFSQPEIVARHALASQELDNMACCPGPEFTRVPASEDVSAVRGKVVSIKFTAVKRQVS